jgi:hypothetical protein
MASESRKWNDLMLCFLSRSSWLCIAKVLPGIILLITLANCAGIKTDTHITTPEAPTQQSEPLRPEPREPHIIVTFYGLDESALGRLFFHTLSGDTPLTGSHTGNGEMRVVLLERQGVIYIESAEAEGFVSHPISYTIQLSGEAFYLVENGQITTNEASNLDFQFTPVAAPTDD